MFAKTIIDSDIFLDMPLTAQALYFHLSMRADDDGFINNPKKIQRMTGATDDDFKLLITKQFIITFESGVVVIKHWLIHNYIRKDRYQETICKSEKSLLELNEINGYELQNGERSTNGQPNGDQWLTQVRKGKVSEVKVIDSIVEDRESIDLSDEPKEPPTVPEASKPTRHKYGEYKNILLTDDELEKWKAETPNNWSDYIETMSGYVASTGRGYKNYLAALRNWKKRDNKKGVNQNGKNDEHSRTFAEAHEIDKLFTI